MAGIRTLEPFLSPSTRSSSTSFSTNHSFNGLKHSVVLPYRARFSKIYALSSNDIKVGTNLEVDGAPWKVLEFLHVKPGKGAAFVRTKMRNYVTGNTVEKTFRAGVTFLHVKPGKGAAFVRTKMRNYVTGNTVEKTFRAGVTFLHVKPGKGAAFVRTKMRNYVTGNTVEKTFRAGVTIPEANVSKETKQFTYKDGNMYVFMDLTTYEEFRLNEADVGDKTKWLKEGMDCNLQFWNGKAIDLEVPLLVKLTVVDTDPGVKGDAAQGGTKPATLDTGAVVNVPLFVNIGDSIMVDTRTGQYTSRA